MARLKESTTVYLETEIAARLRLLAKHSKVPMAVFIREAIRKGLPQRESFVARGATIAWDEEADAPKDPRL